MLVAIIVFACAFFAGLCTNLGECLRIKRKIEQLKQDNDKIARQLN